MGLRILLLQQVVVAVLLGLSGRAAAADDKCERLKATLTYTQEKAPRDLSSVLPVVVEKVNRVLDGVVDVEVEWTGAELHGRVGEHFVKSTVTRLATAVASSDSLKDDQVTLDPDGRKVTTQCFHVPFTILDTNECTLPAGHPMKHKCGSSSMCINTVGSYECVCPTLTGGTSASGNTVSDSFWKELEKAKRSPWEVSFSTASRTSCPSSASTHGCCPEMAHTAEGQKCRQRFQCPVDPCQTANECASSAQCVRSDSPTAIPNYQCNCPAGLMGNGKACKSTDPKPQPKVMFDGKTPTELTVKNNFYCGCSKPIVDACSGFPACEGKHEVCTVGSGNKPRCACKDGYVLHETYGCVDQNPPMLKLRNDPRDDKTLRLKQGDEYREYMVDIVDDNAEDYLRSLKVSYSKPLPPGCLSQIGEFHVNYTVAMPWAKVPYVRETRRVVIEDIDECTLDASQYLRTCPPLVPQCDTMAGAKCKNTNGSYECQCPQYSTGDGFVKTASFGDYPAPPSFDGGTSCVDTSRPVITLMGPNPKTFKICECGGLTGIMSPSSKADDDGDKQMQAGQRKMYEGDIKEMIRATAGAELCATSSKPHPKPLDCVKAVDHTYKGDVDISARVVVGEPVQKSALEWDVPYDVKDDAGNSAVTVWRHVIVQEVDLNSVESVLREEMEREKEIEKQEAIAAAIRTEKAKWEREQANGRRKSSTAKSCPTCPPCDCPATPETNLETCQAYCENVSKSCALSDENLVYSFVFWLEKYISPPLLPILALLIVFMAVFIILRFVLTAIYNPDALRGMPYNQFGPGNGFLLRGPGGMPQAGKSPVPPNMSLATASTLAANTNAMFSPTQAYRMDPYAAATSPMPPNMSLSVANTMPANANTIYSPAIARDPYAIGTPQPTFGSPPPRYESPGILTNGNTPGRIESESIYQMSPLITPSKTGDGVRRRNLYT